jgi:hypothetical protein
LRKYLGYPVFFWLAEERREELQAGLLPIMVLLIEEILDENGSNLGPALDSSLELRETLFSATSMLGALGDRGIATEASSDEALDRAVELHQRYPELFSHEVTIPDGTPWVGILRVQMTFIVNTSVPLTASGKERARAALRLTGFKAEVWERHHVVISDNNGLDQQQLEVIDTFLGAVDSRLYTEAFRNISVMSYIRPQGEPKPHMHLPAASGVNIFGLRVGQSSENSFPSDIEPRRVDVFSVALAHEVNHVVDAVKIRPDPGLWEPPAPSWWPSAS